MAKVPGSAGEAQRVVSYLKYQRSFESWQQGVDDPRRSRERHQLAADLLEQLPDRLAKGEFTGTEALMMSSVLLNDLEPDEKKRDQRLQEWLAHLATVAPQPDEEKLLAQKERLTQFKRRQAVAFAEWQKASDQGNREPVKLEQALEEAQRWYNSGEP
ncbi:MAG: hypothetical protein KGL90_12420 [Burkholderiales bacterium]|nr:hypothetical protein [Burkholderiales bacterium]